MKQSLGIIENEIKHKKILQKDGDINQPESEDEENISSDELIEDIDSL